MKLTPIILFVINALSVSAQRSEAISIIDSELDTIPLLSTEQVIDIAKSSDKPYTIIYTLASWCPASRKNYMDAIELEKTAKIALYVVLVEPEKSKGLTRAISFMKSKSADVKYGVLRDEQYGTGTRKRNKKFVKEITPKHHDIVGDFGKFILISKSGEVLYVTSWKDYDKDMANTEKMLNDKIIPLIE